METNEILTVIEALSHFGIVFGELISLSLCPK